MALGARFQPAEFPARREGAEDFEAVGAHEFFFRLDERAFGEQADFFRRVIVEAAQLGPAMVGFGSVERAFDEKFSRAQIEPQHGFIQKLVIVFAERIRNIDGLVQMDDKLRIGFGQVVRVIARELFAAVQAAALRRLDAFGDAAVIAVADFEACRCAVGMKASWRDVLTVPASVRSSGI